MGDWVLGIDLGTTFTAAAIAGPGRVAEILTLGERSAAIPTLVAVRADGGVVTGDAAARRALVEPDRIVRHVKRRLGDHMPILVGGSPWSPQALLAEVLRAVVERATAEQGVGPRRVAVTHPATWGQYKLDLLRDATRSAGVDDALLVAEPVAAGHQYAASAAGVAEGEIVAVYDLGGGTFDATVLRRLGDGWEILGEPQGSEQLGGIDFDEAVFDHVRRSAGFDLDGIDPEDANALAALGQLRDGCTLASAGVTPEDMSRILLIGGSSRIPLVAQLLTEQFRRPIAVDANPKHAVALGAAQVALRVASVPAPVVPEPSPPAATAAPPTPEPAPRLPLPPPDGPPVPPVPPVPRPRALEVLLRALAATAAASIALYVLGRYAGSLPPGWDNDLLSPLAYATAGALHAAFLAIALAAAVRLPTVRIVGAGLAAAAGGAAAGFIAQQPLGSNFEEAIGRNAQIASLFLGGLLIGAVVGASVAGAAPGVATQRTMVTAVAAAVSGAVSWLGAGAASGYIYFSWRTVEFPITASDFIRHFDGTDAKPLLVLGGLLVAMLPVALAVVATRPRPATAI